MGKKKSKPKGIIKPWYTRYGEVHLYDLARGLIPKRVRNVLSALDRLGNRSLGGAAATDWRHIEKNLAEIEDALSTFETALVQGYVSFRICHPSVFLSIDPPRIKFHGVYFSSLFLSSTSYTPFGSIDLAPLCTCFLNTDRARSR